jgi:hypothetical protein
MNERLGAARENEAVRGRGAGLEIGARQRRIGGSWRAA